MCKTPAQASDFVRAFLPLVAGHTRDEIVLCPAFVDLAAVADALHGSNVKLGAQNMYWEKEGAYTGEICPSMLLAVDCSHVIIGHSERRQFFGDTDEAVNKKLKAAIAAGLTAIVCVGEFLEHREAGQTDAVLERQCSAAFSGISSPDAARFTIAYEPVWAIGTGKTATPEIASDAHRVIRKQAEKVFGLAAASNLRILYGGSVKPEKSAALLAQPEIDGALVGGASLDATSFASIVKYGL